MKRFALIILFCATSIFAVDLDPRAVLDEARQLTNDGKYEESLQKHIWYHNHALEINPSLAGVRLSFALSDWVELGKKYPKALVELKKIRDLRTNEIIDGFCRSDAFDDVAAINSHIDETDKTIILFKQIDRKDPELAKDCWPSCEQLMRQMGETELVEKYTREETEKLDKLLADAKSVAQDCLLLGEWVPVSTSNGLGESWSFDSNGIATYTMGAFLNYTYSFENNHLILIDKNMPEAPVTVVIDGDIMLFKHEGSNETQKHTRVSGNGKGIIGKWSSTHSTGGEQILEFTKNNNHYFSVPFFTQKGLFSVENKTLRIEFQNSTVTFNWSIDNNILSIKDETDERASQYQQKK